MQKHTHKPTQINKQTHAKLHARVLSAQSTSFIEYAPIRVSWARTDLIRTRAPKLKLAKHVFTDALSTCCGHNVRTRNGMGREFKHISPDIEQHVVDVQAVCVRDSPKRV